MSRMEINALKKLADSADGGGYTLPAELTEAVRTHRLLTEVAWPEVPQDDHSDAAARLVSDVAAGREFDFAALMAATVDRERQTFAVAEARTTIQLATELAAATAIGLASDLTERIIAEHLRPAFHEVLESARDVASALEGYGLDPHSLVTAPAKARNAYASLPQLVARLSAIYEARRLANTIGHRQPAHDRAGLFGSFETPLAFHPNWKLPAQVPALPTPEDPVERLLWTAGPAGAVGNPWLPTIAEQDAAWLKQFGETAPKSPQWNRVVANA